MFITAKSFAQTGSSCSNPYVMNLANGAGNGEFQFHYPDTVMYVKILGLKDKESVSIEIDSIAMLKVVQLSGSRDNCGGMSLFSRLINLQPYKRIELIVNAPLIDTSIFCIKRIGYSASCLSCDTLNNKITIELNEIAGSGNVCNQVPYCNNLVLNGGFEFFDPNTIFQFSQTLPYPYPWFQFDNIVCGYEAGFYAYNPNDTNSALNYTNPDYYSAQFDGLPSPNNFFGINDFFAYQNPPCGAITPITNNYFPGANEAFGGLSTIGGNVTAPSTEILKASINPLNNLIGGHKYLVQLDVGNLVHDLYSSHIEIDLNQSLNYDYFYYQQPTTNVVLEIDPFLTSPGNNWKTFNTIYEAQGNETSVWIGNLRNVTPTDISQMVNPPCASNYPNYSYIDNLVVKEFFVDAGDPNIIACTGSEIGGASCPFPNGTYEWLPANLFVDNTLYHPTFIGTSNATVSLTVSIVMADGTIEVSDPSYVNVSILPSPSVSILGNNQVLVGNSTTLIASGASYYTWYDNFNAIVGTGASFTTPNLTQTTTYNIIGVDTNGCSTSVMVTVVVSTLPQVCTDLPNVIIIPDSVDESWFINYPGLATYITNTGQYLIDQKNFALSGQVNLSSVTNIKFRNCLFDCFDASEIINHGFLYLERCQFVACNNMWKGIQNNFYISVISCNFNDAEYAINLRNGSRYAITGSTFENNLYGILMGEIGQTSSIHGYDNSNVFKNPLQLKWQYSNMSNWKPWSEAGIRIESLNYVQIGQEIINGNPISYTNKFHNINNGILISNTDVKVVKSMFYSITPLNQSTLAPFLKYDGCAIYAQSTSNPKKLIVNPIPNYNGHEFANCTEGIKTNRVSLNAVRLSMNNMGSGIQCFNSLMCIHYVCENAINAIFRGIEISGAGFANSVNVNTNFINVTNLIAFSGISVTATQLGSSSNVNIKFNVVTAGRTTLNGIYTSKLVTPTLLCNTVKRVNNSSQYSQVIALNGYNISGCTGANLTTNHMEWLSAGSIANNGNDYLVTASPQCNLICNYSGVSNVGFKISNPCPDLTFRRNKIGSHAIGLYYDGSANTGSQPANDSLATEGNKWLGTYSVWGAWNYNSDPLSLYNSIYYFHPSQTTINRPPSNSWNPPSWFDFSNSTFIQPDCTTGACILNQIAKPGNNDYYKAIANGSITTVDYPAQTKWMAQSYLINRLGEDSMLRNSDDSLRYFYFAPESSTLRTMSEIDAKNNNYAATSILISHSVYANDSLLNILAQNMTFQLSDTLMPDTVFYDLSASLNEQYTLVNDLNESFSNDIFVLLVENLNQAKEINDTLQGTNANETILQTINDIYYRFHKSNYSIMNEDDSLMISYIAHLCPLAAGPAVYQARDLYTLLVDSVVYHDSVKCALQGFAREELDVFEPKGLIQKIAPSYFKAYPVPSKHTVELQFTELSSEANLTIINLQGQMIYQTTIPKGLTKLNLEIEAYSEGVYQVFLINNEFSRIGKICKIK